MGKLTAKQEAFCLEYLKDLNATQAAIRAGYTENSARVTACKMLTNANIESRIAELMEERVNKTKIDAAWVLQSAKEVFDRCMQHEPVIVNGEPTGQYKFEHSGANKSLEIIGKHIDVQAFLEKSKVEHSLTDDFDSLMGDAVSDE